VYFQLSRDDASTLDREVRPELSAHDLAHLPVFTAAVRLCAEGQPGPAFTLRTEQLGDPIPDRAEAVRASARQRYGHNREKVEAGLVVSQRNPAVAPATHRERRPKMAPPDEPSSTASARTSTPASN
jgi:hypothetical protein